MAVRTNEDNVILILKDNYDDGDDLEIFIADANAMVDLYCVDSGYSAAVLELIERYVAAHLYQMINDKEIQYQIGTSGSGGGGAVGIKIASKIDLGFDYTIYGQTAKRWDKAGNLAKADEIAKNGGGVTPSVKYLGRNDGDF